MRKHKLCGLTVLIAVAALDVAAAHAGEVAPARHRLAVAANTVGLRFYKSGQLPRAALRFRDATFFDPGYVLAHYNLACVASRLRDVPTAIDELRWLTTSPDAAAQVKLRKAAVDEDLDFVSALPPVRELLGLPAADRGQPAAWQAQPLTWLSERQGVWSAELPTVGCATRTYQFAFLADGTVRLTVRESCDGGPLRAWTFAGSATAGSDGSVRVEVRDWPRWPAGVLLAFSDCPGLAAPASCFTLSKTDGADSDVGPFHRGAPGTSPMRVHAPKTVAIAH